MAKTTINKLPLVIKPNPESESYYAPNVNEWVNNVHYPRQPAKLNLVFMEDPPVIISGGKKYYHVLHNEIIEKDQMPKPPPAIIWPFLVSMFFKAHFPLKRTYPWGFEPTTPLTGKYRDNIDSFYPYEMHATFKHRPDPIIDHWLQYIKALSEGREWSALDAFTQPLFNREGYGLTFRTPLRQTSKGRFYP